MRRTAAPLQTIIRVVGICLLLLPIAWAETSTDNLMREVSANSTNHTHKKHSHVHNKSRPVDALKAGDQTLVDLPLVKLTDQHGISRELRGAMTGGKTIVADFVYTSCKTICPVLTGVLLDLQKQLKACPETNVVFLSITVDPSIDTPERLKDHLIDAQSPWIWLTGSRPVINRVLRSAGLTPGRPEDHPAMLLMGKAETPQEWYRWLGIPSATQLLSRLAELEPEQAHCLSRITL